MGSALSSDGFRPDDAAWHEEVAWVMVHAYREVVAYDGKLEVGAEVAYEHVGLAGLRGPLPARGCYTSPPH